MEITSSKETASKFYRHHHGCGTFHLDAWLTVRGTVVTLYVQYLHMGKAPQRYRLQGDYLTIGGPYGLVQFVELTDYEVPGHRKLEYNFDCYQFDSALPTEWLKHTDRVQIGLYFGNAPHCTTDFQIHLIANKFIGHFDVGDEYNAIGNLKYATCTEEEFQLGVKHVSGK